MKSGTSADLTLPLALVTQIEAVARDEHRQVEDVVRDAWERFLADRPKDAGPSTAPGSPGEAVARLRELRKGNVLPVGMTIRDLMTHGRA